jgi:hypothetical protein
MNPLNNHNHNHHPSQAGYFQTDSHENENNHENVRIHVPTNPSANSSINPSTNLPIPGINMSSIYSVPNPLNDEKHTMNLRVIRRPLDGTPFMFGSFGHSAILATDGRGNQKLIEIDKENKKFSEIVNDYWTASEIDGRVRVRMVQKLDVLKKNTLSNNYLIDDGEKKFEWKGQKKGIDIPDISFDEIRNLMVSYSKGKYNVLLKNCHSAQQAVIRKLIDDLNEE